MKISYPPNQPKPPKKPLIIREALKSRLSLGMTSNKTYYFQTTANHHRFIKVWTSIADLPTSKVFVQAFSFEKVWLRNTLPSYDLDICPNFRSFFYLSPNNCCLYLLYPVLAVYTVTLSTPSCCVISPLELACTSGNQKLFLIFGESSSSISS